MLFNSHRRPKISDLQGALVLMQSPNAASWAMTGHLMALAQNLGINADCTDWNVPDWERGVRKRVAWALFMQDKWGALIFGRGSHIKPDDWEVQPLTDTDFPETAFDDDDEEGSAAIEQGKQTFLQMVALTRIVSRILDTFFTLRAIRAHLDLSEALAMAKPLQHELRAWHSTIPQNLSIEETVARKLSSVGYLHLAYYTAEATLHRAILRSTTVPHTPPELIAITRAAAMERFKAGLEFVRSLKGEHLQSFWYFSSSSSLAIIGLVAAILYATTHDAAEQSDLLKQLAEYRWALRVSARSADFIGTAINLLDSRTHMLEQMAIQKQLPQAEFTSSDEVTSPNESDVLDSALMNEDGEALEGVLPGESWNQNFYGFGTPYPGFSWDEPASYPSAAVE